MELDEPVESAECKVVDKTENLDLKAEVLTVKEELPSQLEQPLTSNGFKEYVSSDLNSIRVFVLSSSDFHQRFWRRIVDN